MKPCGSHKTAELKEELWIFYISFRIRQTLHTHTQTNTQWTHTQTNTQSLMVVFLFIQLFSLFFLFLLFFFFFFFFLPQPTSNAVLQICYNQVLSVEFSLCSSGRVAFTTLMYNFWWSEKCGCSLRATDLVASVAWNRSRKAISKNRVISQRKPRRWKVFTIQFTLATKQKLHLLIFLVHYQR